MMLAILEFYVSSFWVWAGITYGLIALGGIFCQLVRSVLWGRE
jgi:hypothetical protein